MSRYHISLSNETESYSHAPILVILQCDQLSDSVSELTDYIRARANASIYVTTTSGSFQDPHTLWDVQHPIQARVVHCSPEMCDSVVFSLIAYEGYDRIAVVRISDAPSMDALRESIDAGFSPRPSFIDVFDSEKIRSIMTNPCFSVEYRPFNVIDRIHEYENGLSCLPRLLQTTLRHCSHSVQTHLLYAGVGEHLPPDRASQFDSFYSEHGVHFGESDDHSSGMRIDPLPTCVALQLELLLLHATLHSHSFGDPYDDSG